MGSRNNINNSFCNLLDVKKRNKQAILAVKDLADRGGIGPNDHAAHTQCLKK